VIQPEDVGKTVGIFRSVELKEEGFHPSRCHGDDFTRYQAQVVMDEQGQFDGRTRADCQRRGAIEAVQTVTRAERQRLSWMRNREANKALGRVRAKQYRDGRRAKGLPTTRAYSIETNRRWRGLPEPTRPEPKTCECCGGPPNGRGRGLHLDHDHETGKFRGWLCGSCNLGLGQLGDSFDAVLRALTYLAKNR
jgi:hypothetical protein